MEYVIAPFTEMDLPTRSMAATLTFSTGGTEEHDRLLTRLIARDRWTLGTGQWQERLHP